MSSQQQPPSAQPEALRYYILRGNDMIPVLASDQLPYQLQGLPQKLDHRQMCDEGWKFLCEIVEPPVKLSKKPLLEASTVSSQRHSTATAQYVAPDHNVRSGSQTIHDTTIASGHPRLLPAEDKNVSKPVGVPCADDTTSMVDRFASIYQKDAQRFGYRPPHPSGIEPDPSKKEYCTHWIRTGECAFTSFGCKYKHEMPAVDKLRELGFSRGLPKWWAEKSAILPRGPTWMQRRLAHGDEQEDTPSDGPVFREFPDLVALRAKRLEEYAHRDARTSAELDFSKANLKSPRAPPPPPELEPLHLRGRVPDLLLDLGDKPRSMHSSSSSRPSDASSAAPESIDSTPSSPGLQGNTPYKTDGRKHVVGVSRLNHDLRLASFSDSSDSEEGRQPPKQIRKRENASHTLSEAVAAPAKPSGLTKSKYATHGDQVKTSKARKEGCANEKASRRKTNEDRDLSSRIESRRRGQHDQNKSKARRAGMKAEEKQRASPASRT